MMTKKAPMSLHKPTVRNVVSKTKGVKPVKAVKSVGKSASMASILQKLMK